ncbi:MAG: pyrimidine 5'-nucleotidase [Chloroflexi bacterium]|nr:pyrimidine 5'-nucleotidase [Chloroflexota bacterium]
MRFNTFFFDLDETLYPTSSGLWSAIRERINAYMYERMGFPPEQIEVLREQFFREYGTTLRGLQANYTVDMDEYLAFVHNVPLEAHLHPDPELHRVIEALPARKFIFTNADSLHANRVLDVLGLQGLFDGILDVHTLAPYCKPMPESFEMALQAAGSPDPRTCALLDDQARITRAARSLGFYSILVGKDSAGEDADAALVKWTDLPGLLDGRI